MKNKDDQFSLDRMFKDSENWRGPFYFNPKDPRVFVPKIDTSRGWSFTFNCANIFTYIIIVGFILIVIATRYLL